MTRLEAVDQLDNYVARCFRWMREEVDRMGKGVVDPDALLEEIDLMWDDVDAEMHDLFSKYDVSPESRRTLETVVAGGRELFSSLIEDFKRSA